MQALPVGLAKVEAFVRDIAADEFLPVDGKALPLVGHSQMGTDDGSPRQAVARSPCLAGNLKPTLVDTSPGGTPHRDRANAGRNAPPHLLAPGTGMGCEMIEYALVGERNETILSNP